MSLHVGHLILLGVLLYVLVFFAIRYPIRVSVGTAGNEPWGFPDIVHLAMFFATLVLAIQGQMTNQRAERLHAAENRPLVHAVPAFIVQMPSTQAVLVLDVTNYSGFTAKRIRFDVNYGDRFWTSQWERARGDKKRKGFAKGVEIGRPYSVDAAYASNTLPELYPRGGRGQLQAVNAMSLEGEVCSAGKSGFPVQIRLVWDNEYGHTFEEISSYRLLCTMDTESGILGDGRSFTFLPESMRER